MVAVLAGLLGFSAALAADDARVNELERQVRELRQQVESMKRSGGGGDVTEIERKIDVLTREIENLKLGEAAPAADAEAGGVHGLGPAASKVYAVKQGVSIGGYGEFLYQDFDTAQEDGVPSGLTDNADLVRLVLYTGYKFNDRILFNSEIEYEHATTGEGDEEKGEVSVEFAYLDFLFGERMGVRSGLVLVPVGFLNELHEPPIFLGTRRPMVEQQILPTTWRELGAGVFGETGPLSWRAYLTTSLSSAGFEGENIREGRSGGSQAAAEDVALTGRLDWAPLGGLTVGASVFAGDTGQGADFDGGLTLWDAHAEYRWRGLQARALYAQTSIDDAAAINAQNGLVGDASVGEDQYGWYGEVGYDVLAGRSSQSLIPFVRYERWNTQDAVPAGFDADPANDRTLTTVGLSWKVIPNVVVKADWNKSENEADTGVDQVNVGLGFLF
jgi:hypothetical protein